MQVGVTSGAKVVIAMFAATGAIAAIVVVAFLLTNTTAVRCVEGELQDNTVRPDGTILPRVETFSTLEEAESFICRHIPHPRDTDDFTLRAVRVAREVNLGKTIEREGGADIEFEYAGPDERLLRLQVSFPPEDLPAGPGSQSTIGNRPALLLNTPEQTSVRWNNAPWSYTATTVLSPDFALDDLMRILKSVR